MTPAVAQIIRRVLPRFGLEGLEPEILCGKDRHKNMSDARLVSVWLCRRALRMSFPELGRQFGNRDHTTMISAVRKIDRLVKSRFVGDDDYVAEVASNLLLDVLRDREHGWAVKSNGAVELDLGPGIVSGVRSEFEVDVDSVAMGAE